MVGVPAAVRAGNLNFVVGGPAALFERARPHLLKIGKAAIHSGPLGTGNVTKLVKNLATGAEALILQEAVRIGLAGGIPARRTLETFQQVYSGTMLDRWESVFTAADHDDAAMRARGNIYEKDIPLAVALAHELGVIAPIAEMLRAAGERALAAEGLTSPLSTWSSQSET
jgi:3-hydroxyisobutyrate dehydrogenase